MSFLSDSLIEQIATRVQNGVPLQTTLKAAGVTDAMMNEWGRIANDAAAEDQVLRGRLLQFSERIGRAQAECEVTLIESIAQTSTMVGKSGLPEWRAGAWLLNNHPGYRETYRQQREMKITGTVEVSHEHQLVQQHSHDLDLLEQWAALPEASEPFGR
jgi:hypothetical protein